MNDDAAQENAQVPLHVFARFFVGHENYARSKIPVVL